MDFLTAIFPLWLWGLLLFGLVVLTATSQAMGTLRYELREDALCILAVGRVLRRVPYSNIESVRREFVWFSERWKRKSADPNLTLRLREGLFICMVINPPDSKEFFAELESHINPDKQPPADAPNE